MWTRRNCFFSFPSIYKSAYFIYMLWCSTSLTKRKEPCGPSSWSSVEAVPSEASQGLGGALFPCTLIPVLLTLHSLPGIHRVKNAWTGSKSLARREFRPGVSAYLPGALVNGTDCHLSSRALATCLCQCQWGMKPLPLSLIKSPLSRHPLLCNLLPCPGSRTLAAEFQCDGSRVPYEFHNFLFKWKGLHFDCLIWFYHFFIQHDSRAQYSTQKS